jgi:hypothetical protein
MEKHFRAREEKIEACSYGTVLAAGPGPPAGRVRSGAQVAQKPAAASQRHSLLLVWR